MQDNLQTTTRQPVGYQAEQRPPIQQLPKKSLKKKALLSTAIAALVYVVLFYLAQALWAKISVYLVFFLPVHTLQTIFTTITAILYAPLILVLQALGPFVFYTATFSLWGDILGIALVLVETYLIFLGLHYIYERSGIKRKTLIVGIITLVALSFPLMYMYEVNNWKAKVRGCVEDTKRSGSYREDIGIIQFRYSKKMSKGQLDFFVRKTDLEIIRTEDNFIFAKVPPGTEVNKLCELRAYSLGFSGTPYRRDENVLFTKKELTIPDDFPDYFPIPDDVEVYSLDRRYSEDGKESDIFDGKFTTKMTVEEAFGFYKKELSESDVQIYGDNGSTLLQFYDPSGKRGSVLIGDVPALPNTTIDFKVYKEEDDTVASPTSTRYYFDIALVAFDYPLDWTLEEIGDRQVILYKNKGDYGNQINITVHRENTKQDPTSWVLENKDPTQIGSELVEVTENGYPAVRFSENGLVVYEVAYVSIGTSVVSFQIPQSSEYLEIFEEIIDTVFYNGR